MIKLLYNFKSILVSYLLKVKEIQVIVFSFREIETDDVDKETRNLNLISKADTKMIFQLEVSKTKFNCTNFAKNFQQNFKNKSFSN